MFTVTDDDGDKLTINPRETGGVFVGVSSRSGASQVGVYVTRGDLHRLHGWLEGVLYLTHEENEA